MTQAEQNAVLTLARKCVAEHKAQGRRMTNAELKSLIAPYREKAALLNCSDIYFTYTLGIVTGQIRDKG